MLLMAEWHSALGAPPSNCLASLRFGFAKVWLHCFKMHPTALSSKLEVFNKQLKGVGVAAWGGTWHLVK